MKKLIISLLLISATTGVGYCSCSSSGPVVGPAYERCREQEQMFELQKQMLQQQEMQTRLMQEQQQQQQYQYQRQQADELRYEMHTGKRYQGSNYKPYYWY